ncbi:hypothetical protein F2Q70_00042952 [Brassica cretica]|uniref:Uncharacterized protein n=1 Tax=Brassica cretica TaxID=69181 RepID=A0A8S9KGW5_BRACR|nr:hypothetical protein F2Q70_00042952 [Brassica cretica]
MYLPRHNCAITGTQGVHYCGFPIAMKAWMGTIESLPSHVCRTSVFLVNWSALLGVQHSHQGACPNTKRVLGSTMVGDQKGELNKKDKLFLEEFTATVELVRLSWSDSDKEVGVVFRDQLAYFGGVVINPVTELLEELREQLLNCLTYRERLLVSE